MPIADDSGGSTGGGRLANASRIVSGRLDPSLFATHHFSLGDTMAAYDTFADAASTNALKVVLQGLETANSVPAQRTAVVG